MKELKVGEYIRTNEGYIGKLIQIIPNVLNCYVIDTKIKVRNDGMPKTYLYSRDGYGFKHSFNIIDLIEVGDYVNGYEVLDVDFKNKMICLLMPFNEENKSKYNIVWNTKYFIKSVVTKEMMKSVEYRVF